MVGNSFLYGHLKFPESQAEYKINIILSKGEDLERDMTETYSSFINYYNFLTLF